MAQKTEIINEKLEHAGIFDFSAFYGYAHSWLKDRRYGVTEEKYSEEVTGNSRNIVVEWKISKSVSDYFGIEGKVKIKADKLTNVKVEIDGEKKDMNKGKLTVEIKGILIKDPENKWEGSPFARFARGFYNKFIVPERIENMEGQVEELVTSLKEDLKAYLELVGKR